MNQILEFCEKRKIPDKIRNAFVEYCKSHIRGTYNLGGKTVTELLSKFTQKELEKLWLMFVRDLRDLLSKE